MKKKIILLILFVCSFRTFSQGTPTDITSSKLKITVSGEPVCKDPSDALSINADIEKVDGVYGYLTLSVVNQLGVGMIEAGFIPSTGINFSMDIMESIDFVTQIYNNLTGLSFTTMNTIEVIITMSIRKAGSTAAHIVKDTVPLRIQPIVEIKPNFTDLVYCKDTMDLLEIRFNAKASVGDRIESELFIKINGNFEPLSGSKRVDIIPAADSIDIILLTVVDATSQNNGEFEVRLQNMNTGCKFSYNLNIEIGKSIDSKIYKIDRNPPVKLLDQGKYEDLYLNRDTSNYINTYTSSTNKRLRKFWFHSKDSVDHKAKDIFEGVDLFDEMSLRGLKHYIGEFDYTISPTTNNPQYGNNFNSNDFEIYDDGTSVDEDYGLKITPKTSQLGLHGWYYAIEWFGDGTGNPSGDTICVAKSRVFMRPSYFTTEKGLMVNDKKIETTCGEADVKITPKYYGKQPTVKDSIGLDVEYMYKKLIFNDTLSEYRIDTAYFSDASHINMCMSNNDTLLVPVILYMYQIIGEEVIPYNYNIKKSYIDNFIIKHSYQERRQKMSELDVISEWILLNKAEKIADSLYAIIKKSPIPKMKYLVKNLQGNIIKTIGPQDVYQIVKDTCNLTVSNDTIFKYETCGVNEVYLSLEDADPNLQADKNTLVLTKEDGTRRETVNPDAKGLYKIDLNTNEVKVFYTVSFKSPGCVSDDNAHNINLIIVKTPAPPVNVVMKRGNRKDSLRAKVRGSLLVCDTGSIQTRIGIDKDISDGVEAVYWIKKVSKSIGSIDISSETEIKAIDGYIGSYKYGHLDGNGNLLGVSKDISTGKNPNVTILGDGVSDTSMWNSQNAGILAITKHVNGKTVDSTDGWYYSITYLSGCISVDSVLVRYPTFEKMVVYIDNARSGDLCGGTQSSKYLEVRGVPIKDKYNFDLNYSYQWYYMSSIVNGQLSSQIKFITSRSTNILACNVDQEIKYTPLYVQVKQEGICDCPWNPDTLVIGQFIKRNVGIANEEKRIDSVIRAKGFLKRIQKDGRADSLFVPAGQYPLPKMSFNIMEKLNAPSGTRMYEFKKRLGKSNVDNINSSICGNAVIRDTVFTHPICSGEIFIGLIDEGKKSINSVEAESNDVNFFDYKSVLINPEYIQGDTIIYKLKGDRYYYTSKTIKGCTPLSNNLVLKPKDEAVDIWYDANCQGDTVKIYLKGGLEYTLQNPYEYKKALLGASDTVIFTISPEYMKGLTMNRFMFSCTLDSGCYVSKEIAVSLDEVKVSIRKSEQTGNFGQKFYLEAQGADKFYWFEKEDEEFKDTISKERVLEISPSNTTEYMVIGYTAKGCVGFAEGKIIILNSPDSEEFEEDFEKEGTGASNQVITPNGDGVNDVFIVPEKYSKPYYEIIIMSRWGDIIYRNNNYKNDWGGKGKGGKQVPDGTYYYQILKNGSNKPDKRGFITILNGAK